LDKREPKCYLCGRTVKDFLSAFDEKKYDEEIAKLESTLVTDYKATSDRIKVILQKTEKYDQSISLDDLRNNSGIVTKFMPYWRELLEPFTQRYIDRSSGTDSIALIRIALSKAVQQLDSGQHPDFIQPDKAIVDKEKELAALKLKREKLGEIISSSSFNTYETVLKEIPGEYNKPVDKIAVTYVICPVCEDLHKKYHKSIEVDNDWGWDY
jgi:hypothetical protein